MEFYRALSAYYDKLFPLEASILSFLEKYLDKRGSVVDVACGTGTYSIGLAEKGFRITGIDLDPAMIRAAHEKSAALDPDIRNRLRFLQGDMETLPVHLSGAQAGVFCIGNSLVHLPDEARVSAFLRNASAVLEPGGTLLLQIINFDRVLDTHVSALPTLESRGVSMTRRYVPGTDPDHLSFATRITVENEGGEPESLENPVNLLALRREKLQALVEAAGLGSVELYGSYTGNPWEPGSFLTILRARKKI